MPFLYPRLAEADGLMLLAEMRQRGDRLQEMVAFAHDHAQPAPTGGTPIDPGGLQRLRRLVLEQMEVWVLDDIPARANVAQFDLDLGRALFTFMDIVPADAASTGVWTFLSTVVFPDLVALRFPDLHEDRVLGRPRNALRRTWERHSVVGDLQSSASRPLGEDELVGLFERSELSRNRSLARALAQRVLEYDGSDRSAYARRLYQEARYSTGSLMLDVLDEDQIAQHVRSLRV